MDFLNYLRVREWQDIYTQLRQVVKELGIPVNSEPAEYRESVSPCSPACCPIWDEGCGRRNIPARIMRVSPSSRVPACSKSRRSGPS
ncbi:hypothetical protein ACNKHS_10630 [Shigella flexneri]